VKKRVAMLAVSFSLFVACIFWAIFAHAAAQTSTQWVKVTEDEIPSFTEQYPWVDKNLYQPSIVTPQVELEEQQLEDEYSYQSYLGFEGPYYLTYVEGSSVDIIQNSIIEESSQDHNWSARGLIRNHTLEPIGKSTVIAKLYDRKDALLDEVQGKVLIDWIRPGEPAPFELMSQVNFEEVSRVEWELDYESNPEQHSRHLVLQVYWEAGAGDQFIKGHERGEGEYSYEFAAGFKNMGEPVDEAMLVLAWLDSEGRVIWIESSRMEGFGRIEKHGSANFELIKVDYPEEKAKIWKDSQYMMWGIGS